MSDMSVVAFMPVTGRVDRFSGAVLARVADVPLLVHAVRRIVAVGRLIVVAESDVDGVRAVLAGYGLLDDSDGTVRVVSGSITDVAALVSPEARVVLVHDPLRPFAPVELIERVVDAVLRENAPVVPVLPCSDTVKRLDDADAVVDTPDRAGLRVVQTPLGYPAELIRSGAAVPGAVVAGAVLVAGDPAARRLAGPVDLATFDGSVA
jgi:2-C-methyl-D-erythritol 4-phosphate cytidylyltransferase